MEISNGMMFDISILFMRVMNHLSDSVCLRIFENSFWYTQSILCINADSEDAVCLDCPGMFIRTILQGLIARQFDFSGFIQRDPVYTICPGYIGSSFSGAQCRMID